MAATGFTVLKDRLIAQCPLVGAEIDWLVRRVEGGSSRQFLFEIIELGLTCSMDDAIRRCRALQLLCHPDKHAGLDQRLFILINVRHVSCAHATCL
jgi:hypothetical protein